MSFMLKVLADEFLEVSNLSEQTVHKIAKFHSRLRLKSKREGKNKKF